MFPSSQFFFFLLVQYHYMSQEMWWGCQKKQIEMCFIAVQSLSANDNNHLMNVISLSKYHQYDF